MMGADAIRCMLRSSVASPSIGDYYMGGVYVGDITYSGKNYQIIFAVLAAESYLKWGPDVLVGASSADDGFYNTQSMLTSGYSCPAAIHCDNYTNDGFSDWYLPSINELGLMRNLSGAGHPEFPNNNYNFASTEVASTVVWADKMNNTGAFSQVFKRYSQYVRPVRRVIV